MGKVKNWTVEKKDEIEYILIEMWRTLGMDIPDNYEDIVQDCYEDVCETADPIHWSNGDVAIAFRRWIEAQGREIVQPPMSNFEPAMEDKFTEIGSVPKKECPSIGERLNTVGELRSIMSELSDDDQICIETIDLKTGDAQDLYPMYMDVIEGISLTDGDVINEIRFCQMPNVQPDDRDKKLIVRETDKVYKKRCETDSIKVAKAYLKLYNSDSWNDKEYKKFNKVVKKTNIPNSCVRPIITEINKSPRNFRYIDIYQYWSI